ncbi:hypothetical protein [Microcoleus sp. D3_18a_C4]
MEQAGKPVLENGARCEENQDLSRVKFLPVGKRSPHLNFSVAIA